MKNSVNQPSYESLRSFIKSQLSQNDKMPPMKNLIQNCYHRLLKQANNGQRGAYTHHQLQEKLQTIAIQILNQQKKNS